ncbi:mitochondrial coenzyme A diphosphatase NUDT8 [Anopheles maculipalpis]|uniref:mitochondrial coenzyme A diphosphatase NUDT8 n=1 Tax=Anopheles maculipalpis TaxID=1496333 RepID=UPI002159348C|nr:mitochondrial coenzyme A diphosphatase NUDT8 [Anopheles maculipalpis]
MLKNVTELLHPGLLTNVAQQREIIVQFQSLPKLRLNKETVKKKAAILIPLCLVDDRINLLYTLRSSKLRSHRAQVSFPGGIIDVQDSSSEDCALREFEEETGLSKNSVNVWGRGNTIIPYFGPSITPIVGNIINFSMDKLNPSCDEVAKVFTVPVELLACAEHRKHTQYRGNYSMPVFQNGDDTVWGITAIITHLFLTAIMPGVYSARLPFIKKYEAKKK